MKNDLLCLIEQIDYIKSFFHIVGGTGIPQLNVIYDKAEFSAWKQELQLELEGIHDRTHDKFIWSTLTLLKQGFSGWKDEQSYNELSGSLLAIRKNIDIIRQKLTVLRMIMTRRNKRCHKKARRSL